ncbi:hypothetical protein FGO68_gene7135 [Halteria grandinella]|uniref:Uncharacterized protein n=1 Tax=Halteria grandinella TaxID=5974 RepID=A0A8J8NYM1_HALGN|nr:hypothetical protein FGO68_gene7135 [Halteria grandinella]
MEKIVYLNKLICKFHTLEILLYAFPHYEKLATILYSHLGSKYRHLLALNIDYFQKHFAKLEKQRFYFDKTINKFNITIGWGCAKDMCLYMDAISNICLQDVAQFIQQRVSIKEWAQFDILNINLNEFKVEEPDVKDICKVSNVLRKGGISVNLKQSQIGRLAKIYDQLKEINCDFRFKKVTIEYDSHTVAICPPESTQIVTDCLTIRGVCPFDRSMKICQALKYFSVRSQFKTLDYYDKYLFVNDHPNNQQTLLSLLNSLKQQTNLKKLEWDNEFLLAPGLAEQLNQYSKNICEIKIKLNGPASLKQIELDEAKYYFEVFSKNIVLSRMPQFGNIESIMAIMRNVTFEKNKLVLSFNNQMRALVDVVSKKWEYDSNPFRNLSVFTLDVHLNGGPDSFLEFFLGTFCPACFPNLNRLQFTFSQYYSDQKNYAIPPIFKSLKLLSLGDEEFQPWLSDFVLQLSQSQHTILENLEVSKILYFRRYFTQGMIYSRLRTLESIFLSEETVNFLSQHCPMLESVTFLMSNKYRGDSARKGLFSCLFENVQLGQMLKAIIITSADDPIELKFDLCEMIRYGKYQKLEKFGLKNVNFQSQLEDYCKTLWENNRGAKVIELSVYQSLSHEKAKQILLSYSNPAIKLTCQIQLAEPESPHGFLTDFFL